MKCLVFICLCFVSVNVFGQTPKDIEADLLKSFKKIDNTSQGNEKTNKDFSSKLKYYTEKYPATINQDFKELKKAGLDISTSSDNLLRIYSWDTWTGGTMHFFESIFQYKSGAKTFAILDTPKREGDNRPNYNKLYSFIYGKQTYYLAAYLDIGSSKDVGNGLQVFTIENGKLTEAKIIKTSTGLHSELICYYNFFSVVDWKIRPSVLFDGQSKIIGVPLVTARGSVTHKFITYKFTGRYFEKAK